MRFRYLFAAGAFLFASCALAGFTPTTSPVSPDGTAAVVDLPANRHIRNVGGSDGAGLCVFTSLQHAADWQNVRDLDGFREWMRRRPGGGWPQKVDQMFSQFCRERGVPIPSYVQHTGGDESFLELALKTDRVPCVTYAGRDDFYRGRIAHMVNLAHLDDTKAAIIDNNRPGSWVWMTRPEFLSRWRDMDGGWAVVLLAPPPPPHLAGVQSFGAACVCGDECKCKENGKTCPGGCPVTVGQLQCGPNGCRWGGSNTRQLPPIAPNSQPIGNPPGPDFVWANYPGVGWGWVQKSLVPEPKKVVPEAPAPAELPDNFGVDTKRIHASPSYSLNGVEVTRSIALAAMLPDDSDRWHLTAVGDAALVAKFKADVAALDAATKAKLLVQALGPSDWQVEAFKLPTGVNLRKPSPVRSAADVGTIPPGEYGAGKLAALLALPGGPSQPGPKPAPEPKIEPAPSPVPVPVPLPLPVPVPGPNEPSQSPLIALAAVVLAILVMIFRKKV